jgi:hypothetical protein
MTIYGVSQSTGTERRLDVERVNDGIVLIFADQIGRKERERILVPVDLLLTAVTDPTAGGSTIEGVAPPHGAKMQLNVEVRRNEVLLSARAGSAEGTDAAVGLDDLQDALETAINRG